MRKNTLIDEAVSRRTALKYASALFVAGAPLSRLWAASDSKKPAGTVNVERFSADGKSLGSQAVPKVVKTDAEWRSQLPRDSYSVTRHEDTEAPNSGEYVDNHADGLYRCICCDNALFDSKTKFNSGTGWPSFWKPISARNVTQSTDRTLGMRREAISCTLCDAHLGHVFDDGPRPTGLRYCMNSVALKFVKRA